jgi:hypothetical protein
MEVFYEPDDSNDSGRWKSSPKRSQKLLSDDVCIFRALSLSLSMKCYSSLLY